MGATPALDCGREPAGHSCSSKGRARRTTTKWDKAGASHSTEKLWHKTHQTWEGRYFFLESSSGCFSVASESASSTTSTWAPGFKRALCPSASVKAFSTRISR